MIIRKKTDRVLNFLGHYIHLHLPEEIDKFEEEIDKITKKRTSMGIIEAIQEELKRQAMEEGRAVGIELGLEEGREQGIEQGIEQGQAQLQKTHILKLHSKGFSNEAIAELLDIEMEIIKDTIDNNSDN